jgi:hypothetical protein
LQARRFREDTAVDELVSAFEMGGCLVLRVLVTRLLHPLTVEATVRQLKGALRANPKGP